MWDPDGAGPLAARLVIGGTFSFAGNIRVSNIAMWDGSAWQALSSGIDGPVLTLAATTDGRLYAGGYFANAGGNPASSLAVWNGTTWSAVGGVGAQGVDGVVTGLVVRANGHLIVAGSFQLAGATAANNIARWNGTAWFSVNQGLRTDADGTLAGCNGLALAPNGSIIVVGSFNNAGPLTGANNIARLTYAANGTSSTWTTLGAGLSGGLAFGDDAAVQTNGNVVVVGSFTTAGTTPALNIARWNGTTWSALGAGLGVDADNESGIDCTVLANGDIVAAGSFTVSGTTPMFSLARWNGTTWSPIGAGGDSPVTNAVAYSVFEMPSGEIFVGGPLRNGAARWNGTAWLNFGTGFDGQISRMIASSTGGVVAAGSFRQTPNGPAVGIARFDGTTWSPIGTGLGFLPSALLSLPGGEIMAAGAVPSAGGGWPYTYEVRQWDGTSWNLLSTGFRAFSLVRMPNGEIVAAGNNGVEGALVGGVYRWDGTTWTLLGGEFTSGGAFAQPSALVTLPNGDLIAGGSFDVAGGTFAFNVARWNGTTWSAMADGLGDPFNFESIYDLAVTPAGVVVAVGQFVSDFNASTTYNGVAQWNGTAWQPMADGFPFGFVPVVASLTDGSIVVAGAIDYGLQRWDGTAWAPVDQWVEGYVSEIAPLPGANFAVGGTFAYVGSSYDANAQTFSGGTLSNSFAVHGCSTPFCPADLDDGTGTGTPDGGVDINDLLYFLTQFESGSAAADLDNGSGIGIPDGGVDINDLLFFLVRFEQGC
jgi:hypothetical protein